MWYDTELPRRSLEITKNCLLGCLWLLDFSFLLSPLSLNHSGTLPSQYITQTKKATKPSEQDTSALEEVQK